MMMKVGGLTRFFAVRIVVTMSSGRTVVLRCALSLALAGPVLAQAGCEKADHENIDRWTKTQKGPDKLKKTLNDPALDADLSAHAGENMLKMGQDAEVRRALETMSPDRRALVTGKLAPRLWTIARVEGDMTVPTPAQIAAKDMLFELRKHADAATRGQIDGYLSDWYTSGYYEGRATLGKYQGAAVIRTLGASAGEKLMSAANAVLAAPKKDGKPVKVGDELLLGLAVSGHPEAVKYVLDVFRMQTGDKTLPERAMSALYRAFAEPGGMFDVADPAPLVPNLDRIVEVAKDDTQSAQVVNDAVGLIRATGMPHCLPPLLAMVTHQHRDERYRWVGVNNALKCGRVEAIAPVVAALPLDGSYDREVVAGATWTEIAKMSPRENALAEARTLLASPSWVARWIGVEALAAARSKEDLARIKGLVGDKTRLNGYWGDQSDLAKKEQKPEPTLGQRASELARELESAGG
jgi:hypothetical protein